MHASIVVLAALVAVAAGQYWGMPLNPVLGVPFDTPEVVHEKHFHAIAHANAAARSGLWMRKRRDVSTVQAMPHDEEVSAAGDESKEKRQILLGTYGYPSLYSGYPYARMGWWRKKRDVADESAPETTAVSDETKEKRQIVLGTYGYPSLYYSGYPYARMGWWRKKRDVADESAPETTAVTDETKEKRQIMYGTYGAYPSYYYGSYPYARMGWWRKKRDTSEVNAEENSPATAGNKEKRLVPYTAYGYPTFYSGVYGAYPYAGLSWW